MDVLRSIGRAVTWAVVLALASPAAAISPASQSAASATVTAGSETRTPVVFPQAGEVQAEAASAAFAQTEPESGRTTALGQAAVGADPARAVTSVAAAVVAAGSALRSANPAGPTPVSSGGGRLPAHRIATAVAPSRAVAAPPKRSGSNHSSHAGMGSYGRLTIAGIGLAAPVDNWGCRGGALPNRAERWGCAGAGNLYIMGHAYGVFDPLHDAYAVGRLRSGLVASVRTRSGSRSYRLAFARVVPSTYVYRGLPGEAWAWNATARPSLTLQTCWGTGDRYRLIVRFVAVG